MNNKTAIIDYGAGNTRSVINTLERIGADYLLTSDPGVIREAGRVIFPGVGHAAAAMEQLEKSNLIGVIKSIKQPFLGICLGMQLMFQHSEEGNTPCLGLIDGEVRRFKTTSGYKVPHMGWNDFYPDLQNNLFRGMNVSESMYFVHSYYAEKDDFTSGMCDYTVPFSASVQYRNFYGVQFHPEKSGAAGQKVLENFLLI
jgi:imidazole glycerol-phosphate synthase subunit HisH